MHRNEPDLTVARLSHVLRHLISICENEDLTLGEFLHELNVYGHMMVCLIMSLPFLFPVPLPGLSTIFGFVIGVAAVQIIFDLEPWVPKSWAKKRISARLIGKALTSLHKIVVRSEIFIKPRLTFLGRNPHFIQINGVVIFMVALLLALPMPPGFNAPPALAIVILTWGSLEQDGVMVVVGYFMSLLNFLLFSAFFILGYEGLQRLLHF